jgi:hypothetical protein
MNGAEKPAPLLMKEALDTITATVERTDEKVTLLAEQHHDTARAIVTETVAALAATLATMPTSAPRADVALLIADCRDTITEGIGALHTQGAEVLHALHILQAPPAKLVRPQQPRWVAGGVGLVVGVVLMGATWWLWPDGGYRHFLVGLDAVLVKHHPQLPAPVQDAVAAVYGRYQFQTPGSRQKGK